MEVNQETIGHLAKLSNFALSPEQSIALESDLSGIINYISQLDELDTEGIEPTYQVFEMENVWRPDEIQPQEANREELLALTKEVRDYQIKVPKVL
jgi:aspartyl-tRNA(Asn)/glutamyl-tRNA(Gln) amidotransferase subunit C